MKTRISTTLALASIALLAAGCGGGDDGGSDDSAAVERSSKVSGATRIEKCVEQYPDSTKAECEEWEADEQLADDGTHREHEG